MVWRYFILGFCTLLAISGIIISLRGARVEVRSQLAEGKGNPRGLPMIVVGGLLVAIAGLIVTFAAKLLG